MLSCCPDGAILLVDDHAMFRTGLRLILGPTVEGCLLEAGSLSEALAYEASVKLILLDVQLPGISGLEGLSALKQRWPNACVVMLSAQAKAEDVQRALAGGASCFLSKHASAPEICEVLDAAINGKTPAAGAQSSQPDKQGRLSPRLLMVLDLLCMGKSNKAMATELGISENTVRNHVVSLMRHFGASTRTQLVLLATQDA